MWQKDFENELFSDATKATTIWKIKKRELVQAVRTLRQLHFSSELLKASYNKKQNLHKSQKNIMESKLFELLPYTKLALQSEVTLDNIFGMQDQEDRQIVNDMYKK